MTDDTVTWVIRYNYHWPPAILSSQNFTISCPLIDPSREECIFCILKSGALMTEWTSRFYSMANHHYELCDML